LPSYSPVEAVLRGLSVLDAVSRLETCGVNDIHRATGLNRATIVRMLETLEFAGYVSKTLDTARYSLTSRALELSAGYKPSMQLAGLAEPILTRLQKRIGWPSDLANYDGNEMVVIATGAQEGRMFFNRSAGFRAPVFGTSLGLAYMASASQAERTRALVMEAARPGFWNDIARTPELAELKFEEVRRQGYATMDPNFAKTGAVSGGLAAIGVPVVVGGESIAAMNVTFLREVIDIPTAIEKLLEPLQAAAKALAAAVGDGRLAEPKVAERR
jgi:IclR family mhp operon transcriptional activator